MSISRTYFLTIFIAEEFVIHILEAFLQTKPFVSECAGSVRMAGTTGGEWKIFKLEAEEELRVEVNVFQYWLLAQVLFLKMELCPEMCKHCIQSTKGGLRKE